MVKSLLLHHSLWPQENCSFLIHRYHFFRLNGTTEGIEAAKHIPDGHGSIIFNFNDSIGAVITGVMKKTPEISITIPHLGYVDAYTRPNADVMIVSCNMSVLSKIFYLNLSAAYSVLPVEGNCWRELFLQLKGLQTEVERATLFEDFIVKTLNYEQYIPDEIDHAYNYILKKDGIVTVKEMADMAFISERTFRRHFKNRVGVCPKTLIRIVRFYKLWHTIQNGYPIDYQQLCFDGDYFDQAHFIHDFKKITGQTPTGFFAQDVETIKTMSGF